MDAIEVLVDSGLEKRILPNTKTILYVGIRFDYCHSSLGLSYEHFNFYKTLERMNYSLIYFDYDRLMIQYDNEEIVSKMLLEAVYYYQPDILFYFNYKDWINHEVWKEISENTPTKTIIWLGDDHWRYDETESIWELFNLIITTDKKGFNKRVGKYFVQLSQWACGYYFTSKWAQSKMTENNKKIYDVCFVGRCYGERKEAIDTIRDAGIDINAFGPGWGNDNDRRFSQVEFIEIYNQSKIVLNLSLSSEGVPTIKTRDFEVPGCNSLLLTRYSEEICEYFEPCEEIATYSDKDDVIKQIRYYLKYRTEREQVAKAGYERVLKDHTYEKRFKEFLL